MNISIGPTTKTKLAYERTVTIDGVCLQVRVDKMLGEHEVERETRLVIEEYKKGLLNDSIRNSPTRLP